MIVLPYPNIQPNTLADATQVAANFAALADAAGSGVIRILNAGGIYVAQLTDQIISVKSNAATTVELPDPTTAEGQIVTVKDGLGVAAVDRILITTAAGEIDGQAGIELSTPYASISLFSDGVQWSVI